MNLVKFILEDADPRLIDGKSGKFLGRFGLAEFPAHRLADFIDPLLTDREGGEVRLDRCWVLRVGS